jgi:hypothetical protein
MNDTIRKEANRFYWIIKGQLIPESWTDKDVEGIYNSYMKRIWGNHEAIVHEDGFEKAWNNRESMRKDLPDRQGK